MLRPSAKFPTDRDLEVALMDFYRDVYDILGGPTGSFVWNPGSIADAGQELSSDISMLGVRMGDFILVSADQALQGLVCTAYVKANDTAVVSLFNPTGGAVDLNSGTWYLRTIRRYVE